MTASLKYPLSKTLISIFADSMSSAYYNMSIKYNYHVLWFKKQMLIPGAYTCCSNIVFSSSEFLLTNEGNFNEWVYSSFWAFQLLSLFNKNLIIKIGILHVSCNLLSSSFPLLYSILVIINYGAASLTSSFSLATFASSFIYYNRYISLLFKILI